MWIEKIHSSLSLSLFLQMLMTTFVSLTLFISLTLFANKYEVVANIEYFSNQEEEIKLLAQSIQAEIEEHQYSYREAKHKIDDDNFDYDIEFHKVDDDDEFSTLERHKSRSYIFYLSFADSTGIIIFKSKEAQFTATALIIIAGIASMLLFFLLCLRITSKPISYIKTIENGITKLSDETNSYSIPIVGNNELARLAQSVNTISRELKEKKLKEKEDELNQRMLITNISHDLRTPLTSIIGYLDLAKKKTFEKEEAYDYLSIAEKNSFRLEKLISDLFYYSKIMSKDIILNFQKMNIKLFIEQILELKNEDILFSCPNTAVCLNVDAESFQRIIENLLSNAIKHGVENERIFIELIEVDNEAHIIIKNTIDKDVSSKIHKFTQRLYTAKEERKEGSSGLGLSIVSELVKAMNGEFTLELDDDFVIAIVSFPKS